ncbi:MAG: SRPBCC domain-containing protein [Candidatus Sulfotelmatobacter sp.]
MTDRECYTPGPANVARVQKVRVQNGRGQEEEKWMLILVRDLRHSPEKVWQALTDPTHLREWAPFDADGSLGTPGSMVKLTTVGAPTPRVTETTVTRADAPELLEYKWGDFDMRWELKASSEGTRLTLWTNIGHRFIAMGAAGWHICFDVLDHLLSGTPIGRMVGPDAIKFGGWQRLHAEYARQFGIDTVNWPPQAAQKS